MPPSSRHRNIIRGRRFLDQQQVNGEQLRVQRRDERQPKWQRSSCQAVGWVPRECACGLQVVLLDVGRGYFHPDLAFAVLAGPEVAEQRQQAVADSRKDRAA
jgi:hypothetical protein